MTDAIKPAPVIVLANWPETKVTLERSFDGCLCAAVYRSGVLVESFYKGDWT